MTAPDTRLAKLPVWARDLIERLERDRDYHRTRADARDAGDTNVEVVKLTRGDGEGLHLDDDAIVRWTLPYDSRDGRPAVVEVACREGQLQVRSATGGLIIRPHVSNVVTVDVEGREP